MSEHMNEHMNELREAYNATGSSWGEGPVRLYGRLAEEMLDRSPVPVDGRAVLDVGAGSGAVTAALRSRGAQPVQVDFAIGMLRANRVPGVPAVPAANGDVTRLPFRTGALGGAAAGFCLNHLIEPALGLHELSRVVEPGGVLLASTFGPQADHPAKAIVDRVAARHGFEVPPWYREMKGRVDHLLGSVEAMRRVAREAEIEDPAVVETTVDAGVDTPEAMASYRLGMAHLAPFVASLSTGEREELRDQVEHELVGLPPVLPKIVVLAAVIRRT